MYDYLSDEEIKNSGSWNTGITKSKVTGYSDPYTVFNQATSNDGTLISSANNNITIVLQNSGYSANDDVRIYMKNGSSSLQWPGEKMTYKNGEFVYTFSTTNSNRVGFTPTQVKFSINGSSEKPGGGEQYYGNDIVQNQNGTNVYAPNYTFYVNCNDYKVYPVQGSENLYSCNYSIPLYFGCFLETVPNSSADTATNYANANRPYYNNFYWLPNMAQRDSGANMASVQGLVDSELDANGNLTKNGQVLPYFSKTWADNHTYGSNSKPIMRYWESGTTDADKLAFPFYEVLTDTSDSSNGAVVSTSPTNSSVKYARYYQFDSKDANVLFHDATSSAKAYFSETSTPIKTNNDSTRNGFFPFNSSNNGTGSDINCGFGAKFEIPFKLGPDGTVKMVNSSGESADGAGTVNTRFEFTGDDDLWVFIDGKLMLDMGGDHNASSGYIDFATKTAEATNAIPYTSSDKDNLGYTSASAQTVTASSPSSNTFTDRFKAGSFDANGKYTNIQHKMTIFYMERGMLDSNLMIRYNFSAESNFSKMKVQEFTAFDGVNAGLLSATKKAADKDVFKYTVSNQGTDKNNVINPSIPQNGDHTRTVETTSTTILTKTGSDPTLTKFQPTDTSTTYPVAGISYLWVDDFALMNSSKNGGSGKGAAATVANGTDAGSLYLMYGTETNNTTNTEYKESSAEFEGQFDRYSLMTIVQQDQLYTPTANGNNPATLSGASSRTVSDYYSTHKYIWSRNNTKGNEKNVELASGTNSFRFTNDNLGASSGVDADLTSAPQMTEWFVNTVNTGTISVTKNLAPNDTVNDDFEFTIQLTNVFGVPNVNVTDYTGIKYTRSDAPNTELNLAAGGKFTIKKGQTATISGIPVGTHYVISETSPSDNYEFKEVSSGSLTGDKTDTTQSATVVNTRRLGDLTLTKETTGNATSNSFTFNVTLTAPEGVDLSNYTITDGTTTSRKSIFKNHQQRNGYFNAYYNQ